MFHLFALSRDIHNHLRVLIRVVQDRGILMFCIVSRRLHESTFFRCRYNSSGKPNSHHLVSLMRIDMSFLLS
ncbi:hypothetical protein NY2A_b534R [Paramecium bursaria Chlorella virus NY2A]|uniref:Uncharacterized protein b534R n=1 Tax=Paramecium bursaria Chlorella virus NY2A TaxID=46021 RepID=A7IX59_PBCVN|nr:hypothetical protein NY2A_b534R [Paramecium bursaria Chlorella virus NY2A]ABT14933.1 hypothetical protein NY2A_b534R [Paramecium bursaria Chlorella virus NY2A]